MSINMDNIMEASFGEASSTIRGTFKKTVYIRQYETEVMEIESSIDMGDKQLTGAERMLLSAILQAQLEYSVYCNLVQKGTITVTELQERRVQLENSVLAVKNKAEQVLGRELDEYFDKIT